MRSGKRISVLMPMLLVGVLGAALPASVGAASAGQIVRGRLLPVPAAASGDHLTVTAVDVSPSGMVAGTVHVVTANPDGTQSTSDIPERWARIPRIGWLRQRVALPAGASSGTLTGLTDRGEVAGTVTVAGTTRAARWSADGRSATLVGDAGSQVSAVGPRGPWGVFTGSGGPVVLTGGSELVTRAGARTPLSGTAELDAGYRRTVASIGGPGLALVWVVDGVGRATNARAVLWQNGATVRLPVINSAFAGPACVSRVLADGSVAASGYAVESGAVSYLLLRHVGGVPGTDVVLNRVTGAGQPVGGLTCASTGVSNSLAYDGSISGFVSDAGVQRAAYWNGAGGVTVVPLATGERSATGVAVAVGGRMVIQAVGDDGGSLLSLWHNGVSTPLATPDGWTVTSVVELTDAGLLVANVHDSAGTVRPAAWDLAALR